MIIDFDYKQVEVPSEIIRYCDYFTHGAEPDELRYLDCIYMNMGYYGNDPVKLEEIRQRIIPIF
jgi:hypothetical protein